MWVWHAFWRLSNTRPQGMNGYLRIPLGDVAAYATLHGWDLEKRIDFLHYLEILDAVFMKHIEEIQEQEEAKNRGKEPPRKR